MKPNRVKERLLDGDAVFGTWIQSGSPMIANALAHSGMDFVTLDLEHGNTSPEQAESLFYAIESGGATPMARLGKGGTPPALPLLEAGAQGILVAHCQSAAEASSAIQPLLYPPRGVRGLAPFTRVHDYSSSHLDTTIPAADAGVLRGVLVEDAAGLKALDGILETDGLDLVYLGIYDISISMGYPGQISHPDVVTAALDASRKINEAGVVAGAVTRDAAHCKWLLENGFRYLSYLSETALLTTAGREGRAWFDRLVR